MAVMPLGTGNDLALNFGWGNAFLERWIAAPQVQRAVGSRLGWSTRFMAAKLHIQCPALAVLRAQLPD